MKLRTALLASVLLVFPLAACGGGDDAAPAAGAAMEANDPAESGATDADVANIDLCPMLTDEEAAEVASAPDTRIGGEGATYTVTREPGAYTPEQQSIRARSSCRFTIDAGGGLAVVEVVASAADDFGLYSAGGTPIDGLGDEAVDNAGSVYVRVGDVMLSIGEASATTGFNTEILRRIAPDLA